MGLHVGIGFGFHRPTQGRERFCRAQHAQSRRSPLAHVGFGVLQCVDESFRIALRLKLPDVGSLVSHGWFDFECR
jgi:hypothetical protein